MSDAPLLSPGGSLLIATPSDWREACLSVPAMRALQRHAGRLRVLCPDNQLGFWTSSGFSEGIAYPANASAREIAKRLEGQGHGTVLLWEAGEAADACAKAAIPVRYGVPAKGLEKRLTHPISIITKAGPIKHRVQYYLEIAAHLGAEAFVPENFLPVATRTPRGDFVLLAPDSDLGRHYEWPLERWVELAGGLRERGIPYTVATFGPLGHALAGKLEGVAAVATELPALEELSGYTACIAADGSVPHFASHVGTTCVVLFGPGEPEWMRPLGRHHVLVRRKAECSPCFANRCVMDLRCQNDLTVSEALRGIDTLSFPRLIA